MKTTILDAWRGKERLWKVFWVYNFLLGGLIGIAFDGLDVLGIEALLWTYSVFVLAWIIWITVSLWKCAFNAAWQGWGYIVRGLVLFALFSILLGIIAEGM